MKPFRDDNEIAEALSAMRPAPRPEFAAELDARAAAGFPRRSDGAGSRLAAMLNRLRATPPRRVLAPAGAVAVTAVVVATAAVVVSDTGTPTSPTGRDSGGLETAPAGREAAPSPQKSGGSAAAEPSAGGSSGVQFESGVESAASDAAVEAVPPRGSGPYASHAGRREIERSAEIVLGAEPSEVRADAAKVFDAVHSADGIVLRSSIADGAEGGAGAEFELLIPSGKLGDALAAFSGIAEVRSRHESTADITAPTIGVGERLQDSRARIESLLGELAAAETEGERASVEAELRAERARSAALRSRLSALKRRSNFAHVSLRIETGGASGSSGAGGDWGVGDGLESAGRVLAVAAGVSLIGIALLAPLAVIILLAWLAHAAWLRRARRAALS